MASPLLLSACGWGFVRPGPKSDAGVSDAGKVLDAGIDAGRVGVGLDGGPGLTDAGLDGGPCTFDVTVYQNRLACYASELQREVLGRYRDITLASPARDWVCPLPDSGFGSWATYIFAQDALAALWLEDGGFAGDGGWPNVAAQVSCTLSFEDMSLDAARGTIPTSISERASLADNGVEFSLQPIAGVLALASPALLAELFPPSGSASILPRLEAALTAVENRQRGLALPFIKPACPGYTNICLMVSAELTTLGSFLADGGQFAPADRAAGSVALGMGTQLLTEWLAFTRSYGISEFVSPTYSETDFQAAGMGLRFAPDPVTAANFRGALDLLFAQEAGNAVPASGELAGPYSRDYEFFGGQTDIARSMFLSGLYERPLKGAFVGSGEAFTPLAFEAYTPAASLLALATVSPRAVLSLWSVDGGAGTVGREVYLTNDAWVGGTSADFAPEDNDNQNIPISAGLAQHPTLFSVLPDYLDHPGSRAANSGKVTHPLIRPVVVQDHGELLATVAIDAQNPAYPARFPLVNLSTNVIFPFIPAGDPDAGLVLLNGVPFDIDAGAQLALGTSSTLTVQVGTGVVAVTVLAAGGVECPSAAGLISRAQPSATIAPFYPNGFNPAGSNPTLGRLAIYQLPHPELLALEDAGTLTSGCLARAAFLIAAGSCLQPGCAEAFAAQQAAAVLQQTWDPLTGEWRLSVVIPEAAGAITLVVDRNVRTGARLEQSVNGTPVAFPPFSVNGVTLP